MKVLSFLENFLEFLKMKKNTIILKLKISTKSNGRSVKYFKFL